MEHFSYKGGYGVHIILRCLKELKEELAWATDAWFLDNKSINLLPLLFYL